MVRPSLKYESAVWDPYKVEDMNRLDKVQRRGAHYNHHLMKIVLTVNTSFLFVHIKPVWRVAPSDLHLVNIDNEASRTLEFLRRNLGRCKTEVKANAYITLVRLTLDYASSVWDPYEQNLEKDLEQVQRRAARFVFNEYQDVSPGCVSSLMERLRWEPLKDRLTMSYKIHNRLVDIDPSNYYKPGDSRTRGGHRIHQQRTLKDQFRYSFFPRSTGEWNTLDTGKSNKSSYTRRVQGQPYHPARGLDRSFSYLELFRSQMYIVLICK
ncbi:Hypothetical predicted protein [Mytilus galloprovincialis]|uniref:Uncharacterized protein n=1 Tax=Mytilus galloprovincialis TaxID=29158 RepID=A0A8B6C1D6_MYTGA|nr:Hypothetical predicted protein [Mytilus galloprovincialis]